jgi:hypothetical protein
MLGEIAVNTTRSLAMDYPLSIFVLYSIDRREQFLQFDRLLSLCDNYQHCQKILIADNDLNVNPVDYEIEVLKRRGRHFCWSDAWSAALARAKCDKILYLDCDRILPLWYLRTIGDTLKDYEIVHPRTVVNLLVPVNDEQLLQDSSGLDPALYTRELMTADYNSLPCRGPMSGCTAFTRTTYDYLGPLDRSYIAWGYPDLEYQEVAKKKGCVFRPIPTETYHLHHGYEFERSRFLKVNAWNGARFFRKWKLPHTDKFRGQLIEIGLTAEQLLEMDIGTLLDA